MAEIKNAASTEEFNEDGSDNPDFVKPTDDSEGASASTEKKSTDDKGKDNVDGKEGDEDQQKFDDSIDPKNPPEPPVRSSAQHIIARKNIKIEKLKSKIDNTEDAGDPAPSEVGEESDLTAPAADAVKKQVDEALTPVLSQIASEADKVELQALIISEPEAKNFVNHAIRDGKLSRPDIKLCLYCPKSAQQYHHYLGYEPEHWLDILPVCRKCHTRIHTRIISESCSRKTARTPVGCNWSHGRS